MSPSVLAVNMLVPGPSDIGLMRITKISLLCNENPVLGFGHDVVVLDLIDRFHGVFYTGTFAGVLG